MSSRRKRKQARQNGAMAAGTKSPEGIKQSSMNALSHGLTAKAHVLSNESQAAYDKLRLEYVNRFRPQDGVEMDLVDDMVGARWRLRRIAILQTASIDLQMDKDDAEIAKAFQQIDQPTRLAVAFSKLSEGEKSMQTLTRYETTYSRMYDRAMKALGRLQADRPDSEESAACEELRNDPPPAQPDPPPQQKTVPSIADLEKILASLPAEALNACQKALTEEFGDPKSLELEVKEETRGH